MLARSGHLITRRLAVGRAPTRGLSLAAAAAPAAAPAAARDVAERVRAFVDNKVIPVEHAVLERSYSAPDRWTALAPEMEALKAEAKAEGLWNLFLPEVSGMTNAEYAVCAEQTGRSLIAPEVFNCSAPDTGNMEVLHMFGTAEQKAQWLEPLLAGEIRSCFAMTEPAVASSDATNMRATIREDGDRLVLNGVKWWTSGAAHPHCKVAIFMGRVDTGQGDAANDALPRHARHSMVLVPMDTPGVRMPRDRTRVPRAERERAPRPRARRAPSPTRLLRLLRRRRLAPLPAGANRAAAARARLRGRAARPLRDGL